MSTGNKSDQTHANNNLSANSNLSANNNLSANIYSTFLKMMLNHQT